MSTLIFRADGDYWWPRVAPGARHVCCGNRELGVVDVRTGQYRRLAHGMTLRWLVPSSLLTYLRELDGTHAERYTLTLDGLSTRTVDDPAIAAGNEFEAAAGHWAAWLHAAGDRLVYDGRVLMTGALGVRMGGDYLVTVDRAREQFVVFASGREARRHPQPGRANDWAVTPDGWIGYGYFWDARALDPAGVDHDLTVTPWRREGVPQIVQLPTGERWIWTHTELPSTERSQVLGRPYDGSRRSQVGAPCIVLDDFPAVSLSVGFDGTDFVVAGCSARGAIQVHRVSPHAPRRPIVDETRPPVPLPPPPLPIDPPKETPMALEPKHSDLIEAFARHFPPPMHDEGELRPWTGRLCEQFAFSFPSEGWGWKRADPGRPLASDVIARQAGGRLWGYDVVVGAGTSGARLDAHAGPIDLSGQTFVPVTPTNHLGAAPPVEPPTRPPTPPPTTPSSPIDLAPVVSEMNETQLLQQQTIAALVTVAEAIDRQTAALEEQRKHDLVIADEIRQVRAAMQDIRGRLDGSFRLRF